MLRTQRLGFELLRRRKKPSFILPNSILSRRLGVRSILVSPLRHYRRTLGVFEVLSSSLCAFDHRDVVTMQLLSSLMVAAISRISSLHQARFARLSG